MTQAQRTDRSTAALAEIEELRVNYQAARSHFPYIQPDSVGRRELESPSYYVERGFVIKAVFSMPLSEQHIERINNIGHWLNQSVLVRLCAILQSYEIVSDCVKIDQTLSGADDVDILRRLRNKISHGSGRCDLSKPDHRALVKKIEERFGVKQQGDKFPLDINKVIDPLFDSCRSYVTAKLA